MLINLTKIDDGLKGPWWNHVKVANFDFINKVENIESLAVEENDILIHKEIKEGERFPTIRYYFITPKGAEASENAKIKEILAKNLILYKKEKGKLPPKCEVIKYFKNGNVQIDYIPGNFDKFSLKIDPKEHAIDDARNFFGDASKAQKWTIVSSRDSSKKYTVSFDGKGGWKCTCPQFVFRKTECKHIKECKSKLK